MKLIASENQHPLLMISINRTGQTDQTNILPIAENKAGEYKCKVTIGGAASEESTSVTILQQVFRLHIYVMIS